MAEAQAFGEWLESAIRTYRDGRGQSITQKDFARAIDVSPPLVSHWISGAKRPSADMVLRVFVMVCTRALHSADQKKW